MFSKFLTSSSSSAAPRRAVSASSSTPVAKNSGTVLFSSSSSSISPTATSISATNGSSNNAVPSSSQFLLSSFRKSQPLAVTLSSKNSGLSVLLGRHSNNPHQQYTATSKVDQLLEQISNQLHQVNNDDQNNIHRCFEEVHHLCRKIIILSQVQAQQQQQNNSSSSTALFLCPSLEALVRKLLLIREQIGLLSGNNNNNANGTSNDDDPDVFNDLFDLVFENQQNKNQLSAKQSFSLIKSISLGILSSKLATAEDVLLVLRKLRTMFTSSSFGGGGEEESSSSNKNNNNTNNNINSILTDQDRNELSKVIRFATERVEEIIVTNEASDNSNNNHNQQSSSSHQKQYTLIQCFHSLFPLVLHGPFSEATILLQQVASIFSNFVLALGVMIIPLDNNKNSAQQQNDHLHKILAVVSTSKQICYAVSVLARRPSSSTEASKTTLLSVLNNEAKFSLICMKNSPSSSSSSSTSTSGMFGKISQQQSAAVSHALLAFYVLNEPKLLLSFIEYYTNNTKGNNDQQQQLQHQTHWTAAWALAHTNQIQKSLEILMIVAKSRPNGWTGVPARVRNVFTSVGSKLETRQQVQEWCRVIAEMKCPSMRADAANIVAALLEMDTLSMRNREAILEMASTVAASSGLFQSDASKVINHFLVTVKKVELSIHGQEQLVSEIVSIWRDVVLVNISSSSSSSSSLAQLQLLDSRLLETLFFDHAHKNHHETSNNKNNTLFFWISHVARYPNLLRPGALPQHVAITLHKKIESAFKSSSSNNNLVVSALYELSSSMSSSSTKSQENNNFVWSCQLCETTNTYIHSTCGDDSCQAAQFPPLQCNSCSFLNPSNASECHVCSSSGGDAAASSSFTPRPFGKWSCSSCGEREHNVPTSSVISGIRCVKCSKMTGPLVEYIDFKPQSNSKQQQRRCTKCNESPRDGDVFSSQNPSCTSKVCSSASSPGTLVPLLSRSSSGSDDQNHDASNKEWTCVLCYGKNQFWRERCASCLQVCRNSSSLRIDEDEKMNTYNKIHAIITSESARGLWACACGCASNSTVFDQLCTSCGGSMEMNCKSLTFLSETQLQELKQSFKKELDVRRSKSSSLNSSRTKRLTKEDLKNLSSCSVCGNDKDSSSLHLGDFCKNPNCGAALPIYEVLHDEIGLVSKSIKILYSQEQQQTDHDDHQSSCLISSSNKNTIAIPSSPDPVVSAIITSSFRQIQSKSNLTSSSVSDPDLSIASPTFYLKSLQNNLEHLLSLISFSSVDSRIETNVLQKQANENGEEKTIINSNNNDKNIDLNVIAINGLAHRLVRLCAERCVLLRNIYKKSTAQSAKSSSSNLLLENLIDAFRNEIQRCHQSPSSDSNSPFHDQLIQLRRLSLEVSSIASVRWNVMSDSFIRGSLASAVKIVNSLVEISSSSFSKNSSSFLPPKIKFLLQDEGRCKWCLGRHPESMCPKNEDLQEFSPTWNCQECGEVANDVREGAQRYVCKSCLGVRPDVLQMEDDSVWAEVWECPECKRATPMIEDNCIFCPYIVKKKEHEEIQQRLRKFVESSPAPTSLEDQNNTNQNQNQKQYENDEDFMSEESINPSLENDNNLSNNNSKNIEPNTSRQPEDNSKRSSYVTTTLPFFPARCGLCGEVHFEALCPICCRGDVLKMEVRNAFGVVNRIYPTASAARSKKKIESSSPVHHQNHQRFHGGGGGDDEDDFVVATVQPHGTAGKNSLVLVPLSVLSKQQQENGSRISVGSFVRFDAQRSSVRIQSPNLMSEQQQQQQERQVVNFQPRKMESTALCATSITII